MFHRLDKFDGPIFEEVLLGIHGIYIYIYIYKIYVYIYMYTERPTKMSLFFFVDNFYKNKEV